MNSFYFFACCVASVEVFVFLLSQKEKMFAFFAVSSFSIFVPYFSSFSPNRTVSESEFESIINERETFVAIAMSKNHRKVKIIPNTFYAASVAYNEYAQFISFDDEFSEKISKKENLPLPLVFLYKNKSRVATFHYPETDNEFLHLIESFFIQPKPCKNVTELYTKLGNSPFSILCTKENYAVANELRFKASEKMEMIDVVLINQSVFDELGLGGAIFALFRNEDRMIVKIRNDLSILLFSSYPIMRKLTKGDIVESDETIVAISSNRYTEEMKNILFKIGEKYEEFIVGFLGPRLTSFPEELLGKRLKRGKNVVVFNWKNNFFYETESFFSETFLKQPINEDQYFAKFSGLLDSILNGTLKAKYVSEPVPENKEKGVQKVVGKTYEAFINDETKDVVMLYIRENCPHCTKFEKIFKEFVEECDKEGVDWIKFGQIDITKNSCETEYPFMTGVPSVYIFPMNNKSNECALYGRKDREGLLRFINRKGTKTLPMKEATPDKRKTQIEMLGLIQSINNYPMKEQAKIKNYIKELGHEIGIEKSEEDLEKEINLSEDQIERGATQDNVQFNEL